MKITEVPKEEVFSLLKTSEKGLTEEEAKKRLSQYGYNEIEEVKKSPVIFKFLRQFTHFLQSFYGLLQV
jgi:magnesium-transporting ATPase (P-type)